MKRTGLLHLYYGDGKGKTTAAMGLALRAMGSGKRVVILQFLKGGKSGEVPLLEQLGAKVYRGKAGQKFVFQMNEAEKEATRQLQNANLTAAIVALGLSGLSDALDGMIARHFNQITELGKMLDPLADKLTQGTVAICIAVHYPSIWPLLALLVLKELVMLCGACYLLKNGKKPCAAKWYGKVSTTLFYIAIGLIVVMDGFMKVSESTFNIASTTALVITAGFMVYTFIRYFGVFREILRSTDGKYDLNLPEEMRAKKERTPKN